MKKSKVIFLALLACAFGASARTVTQDEATRAARFWAARGTRLGSRVGGIVRDVVAYNTNSLPAFYAIEFANGGGTVFTSANTENEPILAFSKDSTANLDPNSPLAALLYGRTSEVSASTGGLAKWQRALTSRTIRISSSLNAFLGASETPIEGIDEIDDVRVAPLTKTKWAQAEAYDSEGKAVTCYDYYTPTCRVVTCYAGLTTVTNDPEHQVCGCVATAMAQVMKYWEYPTGVRASFTNEYCQSQKGEQYVYYDQWGNIDNYWSKFTDQTPITLYTEAGAYNWENMTEVPSNGSGLGEPVEEINRQAIGKLTYDCGVSVGMDYGISATGGSGIYTSESQNIADALVGRFDYTNALLNEAYESLSSEAVSAARQKTILANLDAGCPVMLLITGSGGHAVVGDGYGYSGDEKDAYVHLNMGWSGQCDVWYNLPLINTADNPEDFSGFDTINSVVYNIFTTNVGEIVSGHVTTNDADGAAHPVSNLVVTVTDDLGAVYETTTSEYGVYALLVPAGRSYRVYAELPAGAEKKIGEAFTGVISASHGSSVGNSWGNDLKMDYPTARIGDVPYVSLDRALDEVAAGDTVEILRPTELRKQSRVAVDCTIVATNVNAAASAVTPLGGAQIEVADGASVSVSNVAFAVEHEMTVVVSEGGVLRIGGYCGFGAVWTAAASNLVVQSELACSFDVCCTNAVGLGDTFAYGADGIAYLTASNCANRMLHYSKTRWGGEAYTNTAGKVFFRWSNHVTVPDDAAVGQLNGVNYRSLIDICEDVIEWDIDADIVLLKDASFTNYFGGAHCYMFRSAGARCTVTPSGTAGFTIPADGSLTISNLVFSGYRDAEIKDDVGFIRVNGGGLTLESGAELNDIEGQVTERSGVIDVVAGTLNMHSGSGIINCKAKGGTSHKGRGGAIYAFATNSCVLNLDGGTISSCDATVYGGGIYVNDSSGRSATVNLSGDMIIADNTSDSAAGAHKDDLCFSTARALPRFRLKGNLCKGGRFGKVGIRYAATANDCQYSGNKVGEPFIMNEIEGEVSPETLLSFFSDKNNSLVATTNAVNQLVWKQKVDDGQCDPANAVALLIDAAGTTNYYASVELAFAYMGTNSPYVVELQYDSAMTNSITVPTGRDVTLRSAELTRDGDFGFVVPTGTSLTLTDIDINGGKDSQAYWNWVLFDNTDDMRSNPFFNVQGGQLNLFSGAMISDAVGFGNRASSAIRVSDGGAVYMYDGAEISYCSNVYESENSDVDYGVGGGILVDGWHDKDTKSTAYLRGGTITSCYAKRGGAVCVCNGAEVYVSGAMRVEQADWYGDNSLVVEDSSSLYLDAETDGFFNMADGANGPAHDPNFIGHVIGDWKTNLVALTNSAAKFVHSVSGDFGMAVTNRVDTNDVLIVWCGAVRGGQLYTNLEGKVYAPVTAVSSPVPVSPAFTPLPALSSTADEAAVAAALVDSALADPSVKENVKTLEAYNDFREWAQGVDGGVDAVVSSEKAASSYKFGTTALLTKADAPTVEITAIENVTDGLKVSVIVKDGDDPVAVASEKVAAMFEATSDVGDWGKSVDLTVTDLTQSTSDEVQFRVVPKDNPDRAFIRLKY